MTGRKREEHKLSQSWTCFFTSFLLIANTKTLLHSHAATGESRAENSEIIKTEGVSNLPRRSQQALDFSFSEGVGLFSLWTSPGWCSAAAQVSTVSRGRQSLRSKKRQAVGRLKGTHSIFYPTSVEANTGPQVTHTHTPAECLQGNGQESPASTKRQHLVTCAPRWSCVRKSLVRKKPSF